MKWPESLFSGHLGIGGDRIVIRCDYCGQRVVHEFDIEPMENLHKEVGKAIRFWNIHQFLPNPVKKRYF